MGLKKMVKNLLKENETLRELLFGILFFGFFVQIPLAVFTENRLYHAVGLWAGVLTACIMAVHMAAALDNALMMGEKGATGYLQKKAVLRYVLACVLIVILGVTDAGNPVTYFLGVMGLKLGAYLQPVTHKLITYIKKSKDKGGE